MRNIEEIISSICESKAAQSKHPSYALYNEIKREYAGVSDAVLERMLSAKVEAGILQQHRTINSYGYALVGVNIK